MTRMHGSITIVLMACLCACATATGPSTYEAPVVRQYEPSGDPRPPRGEALGEALRGDGPYQGAMVAPTGGGKSKLYIVGMGPAGPDMATLQALRTVKEADVVFCEDVMRQIYGRLLEGKDVRNSWQGTFNYMGRDYLDLKGKELRELTITLKERGEAVAKEVRGLVAQGKTVAIMEFGDPLIYGPIRFYMRFFKDDEFEVIPGMSSLNAANAALKREAARTSSSTTIILTSPKGPQGRKDSFEAIAALGATVVIYMGLQDLPEIVSNLSSHYAKDTPVAIVYWAGIHSRQKILRSTLGRIVQESSGESPQAIGLIYVGNFLNESFSSAPMP